MDDLGTLLKKNITINVNRNTYQARIWQISAKKLENMAKNWRVV